MTNKIQIFLSYASEDLKQAERLYQKLEEKGFKPWMDRHDLLAGQPWEFTLIEAINRSDFILICLSNNSVNKRGVLQKEIKFALEKWQEKLPNDIFLIPVKLNECEVPEVLKGFQWVNYYANEREGLHQLVEAIQGQVSKSNKGSETLNEDKNFWKWILRSGRRYVFFTFLGLLFSLLSFWALPNLLPEYKITKTALQRLREPIAPVNLIDKLANLINQEFTETELKRKLRNISSNPYDSLFVWEQILKSNVAPYDSQGVTDDINKSNFKITQELVTALARPIVSSNIVDDLHKLDGNGYRTQSIVESEIKSALKETVSPEVLQKISETFKVNKNLDNVLAYLCIAHMIIISILIFMMPRAPKFAYNDQLSAAEQLIMEKSGYLRKNDWLIAKRAAEEALDQFELGWSAIWYSWLFLYFCFLINIIILNKAITPIFVVSQNFANNLATVMFAFCYLILTRPTLTINYKSGNITPNWIFLRILIPILLFFAGIEIYVRYTPEIKDFLSNISIIKLDLIEIIGGLFAGTVTALFVGRLDSSFFQSPKPVIILLYLYAALQPLYTVLGKDQIYTLALFALALLFKLVLFLLVAWIQRSGQILFYFIRMRHFYYQVKYDWNGFAAFLKLKS